MQSEAFAIDGMSYLNVWSILDHNNMRKCAPGDEQGKSPWYFHKHSTSTSFWKKNLQIIHVAETDSPMKLPWMPYI